MQYKDAAAVSAAATQTKMQNKAHVAECSNSLMQQLLVQLLLVQQQQRKKQQISCYSRTSRTSRTSSNSKTQQQLLNAAVPAAANS